ncbi:AAA family ATPase [Flammeovirga agarivorans]|uniref:MoxR family ATPase n=1 Tax=Flammeovirga agarivorans TaxID=2726742 RepID=A0A7X8XZ85_9BACT|nr:MoxR family ATPase [Flammeovirga agarivorans]NLR94922.1 MoxR family ATPase [Flammeovirga agarivorans]
MNQEFSTVSFSTDTGAFTAMRDEAVQCNFGGVATTIVNVKAGEHIVPKNQTRVVYFEGDVQKNLEFTAAFEDENFLKKNEKAIFLATLHSTQDGSTNDGSHYCGVLYLVKNSPKNLEYDKEGPDKLSYARSVFYEEILKDKSLEKQVKDTFRRKLKKKTFIERKWSAFKKITVEDDKYYADEFLQKRLVHSFSRKANSLLVGHTGTGKTVLAKLLLEKLNMEYAYINMGAMQDAISGLIGNHIIKDGESVFEYSPFVKALKDPNVKGILLDEISRAPSGANNILFPVLDGTGVMKLDTAFGEDAGEIDVSDKVFIATANLGADYSGTHKIDRALLDRFRLFEVEYVKSDIEQKILMSKYPSLEEKEAQKIASVFEAIRDLYQSDSISTFVSIRYSEQVAEMVADGFPLIESLESVVLPLFEKGDGGEQDQIRSTFLLKA